MMIRITDVQNVRLTNVLYADLMIIWLKNVRRHLKRVRNGESKYVLMKEAIVQQRNNATTEKMSTTKRYMHICHVCLIMTNFMVENFGVGSQLRNWILDSGSTCHMKPDISKFIPGLLYNTDEHVEVADGNHVMAKKKGKYK